MKIWTSAQRAVERRVDHYIHQLERTEEKEALEHMAQCGAILSENRMEIEIYLAYKQGKSIPACDNSAVPADKT